MSQSKIILLVANLKGQTLRLEVQHDDSVISIKQLVQHAERYEMDAIGLEFCGKVLDDDRKISDYNLRNESTLTLRVSRRAEYDQRMEQSPIQDAVYGTLDINAGITLEEPPTPQPPPVNPALCVNCPDEPPAEFVCITCPALPLCLSCKDRHVTRMKGHQAVPVEESKDAMCTKHPDKRLEMCCVDPCHELICLACGLLEHTGHKFNPLADAAEKVRAELERLEAEAKKITDASFAAHTKDFEDCVALIAKHHEFVNTEGEKLIRLIEQRMAEAHAAIDAMMGPELECMGQDKKAAMGVSARVRSHAAVSRRLRNPEKCSHADVFRLSPLVCRGFEAIKQMSQPLSGNPRAADSQQAGGPAAGGSASAKAAAAAAGAGSFAAGVKGPKLVVCLEAAAAMAEQAKALFKVEEQVQVGPRAAVVPLARREGGIIGGPDTLKNLQGNAALWHAVAGSGQPSLLFVSSRNHNCVRVFDAISGASIRQIATGASPMGLALRSAGPPGSGRPAILFVAEAGNNRIQALNADTGTHIRYFGTGTAGAAADQLNKPYGVALHEPAPGSGQPPLLFVADYNNHRVQVFDADTGALVRTIGTTGQAGNAKGQFSCPADLALRSAGPPGSGQPAVLYVADAGNSRIQAVNADTGTHIRFFGTGKGGAAADQLNGPYGVALHEPAPGSDQPTLLFVADWNKHRVQVFDADTGVLVRTIGTTGVAGAALGQLNGPSGVMVHPGADGTMLLFVTEYSNNRVQVFVL